MKNFIKTSLSEIPLEAAHGGAGKRQMLITSEHVTTKHLEAITKGFLKPGEKYPIHRHDGMDEICIVQKGRGKFTCEDEVLEYSDGDVFSVHANTDHTYEATETTEFYFIRVRV